MDRPSTYLGMVGFDGGTKRAISLAIPPGDIYGNNQGQQAFKRLCSGFGQGVAPFPAQPGMAGFAPFAGSPALTPAKLTLVGVSDGLNSIPDGVYNLDYVTGGSSPCQWFFSTVIAGDTYDFALEIGPFGAFFSNCSIEIIGPSTVFDSGNNNGNVGSVIANDPAFVGPGATGSITVDF